MSLLRRLALALASGRETRLALTFQRRRGGERLTIDLHASSALLWVKRRHHLRHGAGSLPAPPTFESPARPHPFTSRRRNITTTASTSTPYENASVLVDVPGLRPEERFELPRSLFDEVSDRGEVETGMGGRDTRKPAKIVVAMSGGVDSSLTLALLHAHLQTSPLICIPQTSSSSSNTTPRDLIRLRRRPIELSAVFMRNWSEAQSEDPALGRGPRSGIGKARSGEVPVGVDQDADCAWEADWQDVRRVCAHLGLGLEPDLSLSPTTTLPNASGTTKPLLTATDTNTVSMVDLSKEYWLDVFEPAVGVWDRGGTPNPDVGCNREIKFGALMDRVLYGPDDFLATGHYARLARHFEGSAPPLPSTFARIPDRDKSRGARRVRTRLIRAMDASKDQTYYLSSVPEDKLAKAIFPLASIPKSRVRELARHFGLPTAEREESMGVCFIGERGRFGDFVSQYTSPAPKTKGDIVTLQGTVLGTHDGLWHYTIGQRARIGGMNGRWFVSDKKSEDNVVVVVPGSDHPHLLARSLSTQADFSWIYADHPPAAIDEEQGLRALAQVRHRMKAVPCTVRRAKALGRMTAVEITFDEPEKAIAPGQVVALWLAATSPSASSRHGTMSVSRDEQGVWTEDGLPSGDWCLGSGTIASRVTLGQDGAC